MEYELINEFQKQYRVDFTRNTMINYVSDIKQFLDFVVANLPSRKFNNEEELIKSIRWGICNEYKNTLVGKNLRATSVNRKIESIKAFFGMCVMLEIIDHNPMSQVKKVRDTNIEHKQKYIAKEDVRKLLMAINTKEKGSRNFEFISARDSFLYTLILTVGFRIDEALSLEFENLQVDEQRIQIIGKGEKWREVPLTQNVLNLYYNYLAEREKINVQEHMKDKVFISNKGGAISTSNSNNALKKYCERANVTRISNHVLRHTCATGLIQRNVEVNTISKILGHSNIATTSRYVHSSLQEMKTAIEKSNIDVELDITY